MKKLYILVVFLTLLINSNSLFGQLAGAPVVAINSGNPKFPFPQFLAYSNGASHSIGNLGTTNAPGVVHAEMEKNIREAWQIFANQFTYTGTVVGGVKYIVGNTGCPYDCSEGDGYALLAAAYMGDKTTFDGLWMRTHDVRLVKYPRYSDCVIPRPTYKYGTNTLAEPGGDAATDGDVDIALALLMAWYQWGDLMGINDNCGTPISYKNEALHVITGLVELQNSGWGDCRSTTGEIGLDGYLKNGNTWNETTGWASAQNPCPEFKGPTDLHVDYMAPAYFRAFREFLTAQGVTGWSVDQLYRAEASSDWIVGEWINKSANNVPIGGWVNVTSGMPVWAAMQQGEDFRAPWRTILNYVWNGNPNFKWNPTTHQVMTGTPNTYEYDAAVRHSKYLNSPQSAPWNSACVAFGGGPALTYNGPATLQWNISPTGVGSSAFTLNWVPGTGCPAAVGAQDYNLMGQLYRQCTIEWDVQTAGDGYLTSKPVYFHGWFRHLGLLVVSGNAHSPTQMLPKANLKIYRDIQLGKTFAYTGDNITYNLSYRNYGSVDALGTKIIEKVPVDFAFVSATNGGVYDGATHTVTWTIGTVPGFKTGALAATQGSVSYTTFIKPNATGRYCTTADITCSNGLGWTSNEFPNDVSATMRRNCVDVIARALKVEKSVDRTKANKGNMVTYTINFENSIDAGWIDGGRPGVNISFAHPVLATPTAVDQSGIKIRLFHDAVEPYIDYGNYRISYFINDPGLICYVGNAGCPTGWDIASSIYEGGAATGVKISHEMITPGSDARGSWNQRLVVQFAPLLVTTTPHLSNYYGMGARIHLGGTAPLRAVWRVFPSNYNATNWADDWSWDAGAGDGDAGLYFPVTPDWTDPGNPNIPVTKWHQHSCQTATKTVDNVLVEEYDGYVWRRILGNGPIPGRDILNVVIKDTLPTGLTFGAFVGANPFGIAPTITTIAGGKQVISWTIPKLQAKQKGAIVFTATVAFPSGANCTTADENLINKAWISGDNESAIGDTAKVVVTCAVLPTVIKPTTLVKTADKATYASGDPITYTLKYTQTHGSISTPSLNNLTDWTGAGAWTAGAGKITTVTNNTGFMTYDYAYGKNGYIEATVTPQVYATFRVMFRQGSATPIALGIKPLTTSSMELTYIQGGTVLQTTTLTYGGGNPFVLKADLYDGILRLWINGDTATSPIWNRTGVPIGIGYGGFGNGNATGGDAYGTHSISNLQMHFDYGYNLVITDPIPAGVSFTSAANSGVNSAGTVTWTIPSAKGAPIPFGTVTTVSWTGVVNTCNTILENIAYVNMMGHVSNSIAGQVVVNCGASCPAAPTVISPVNYCVGQIATPLTATGTALKWYTVPTGGTGSGTAPTPSTATPGTTIYYVTQTANGCESPRAPISVIVSALPATPTITSNTPVCAGSALNLSTAAVTGATYAWTGPNSFTSAVQSPSIASPTTAASGTYNLTIKVGSCTSAAGTATVTVNAIPATPTISSNTPVCAGSALNLTTTAVAGATYAWTGPNSFTSAVQNPTIAAVTTLAGGTYNLTITTNGCTSTAGTTAVVINAIPTTPTAGSNSPICAGGTLNLTAPTLASATYAWTGPNSFTSTLQNPTIANATTAATGTYSVIITRFGCVSAAGTTAVVVNAIPTAPTITSNTPVCAGSALNLTTTAVAGATYAWTGPNSFTSAVQNPTIASPTTAATGTYSLTITTNGCTSTAGTTAVVVNAIPAAPAITSNSPICAATALNLTTTAVAGATYTWTGPNSFTSAVQNPTIASPTTAATGTYSLTITTNGCTSTAGTTAVTINAIPATPTASSNTPICAGATLNLTTPAVAGATYAWTGPNSFTSTLQNPTIAAATSAATGTYNVTVTTSGCASIAGTTAVVVNAIPTAPAITSNTPVCVGSALNLSTTAVAGATYAWTGPNSFTSAVQNPTIASPTTAASGTYSLTITTNGCTSTAGTTAVMVNAIPAAPTITSNSPICAATALNLTTTAVAGATYAWTGPNSFTSAVQNPTIASPTTAATGTYSLTITTNGCTSTAGTTAVVINAIPATPTASSNTPICAGATLNLTTPAVAGATYAWTGPNSFTSAIQNPSIAGATTAASGTYSVTITSSGCTSIAGTTTVVVNAIPTTPAPSSNSPICAGATLNLTTTAVAGATYAWTGPNSFTSALQNPTIAAVTAAAAGTYNLTVTTNGCTSSSGSTTVTINAIPTITINPVSPVCVDGSSVTLSASATPLGGTGTFSGTGVTGSTFNPTTAGVGSHIITYNYTVNGCSNSATITIIVQAKPTVSFTLPATACASTSTIALTGNQAGGTFSVTPSIDISSGFNPAIATPNTAYAITYSYSDGVCSNTVSHSITVYNPAKPIGTPASQVYTLVPPVPALTATGINQIWYSDAGLTVQVGTGASFTPATADVTSLGVGVPGVYTYYVKSTEGGCSSASTPVALTITSCSATVPTPVSTNVEMCFGDLVAAHKTLEVTTTGNDIRWYFGGVSQQTGASKTFIPSQTAVGTYTFDVSQYDGAQSCESPKTTITLTINALPTVSLTLPAAVCQGSAYIDFTSAKSQAAGIVTCVEAASTCTGFDPITAGTFNFNYSYTNPGNTCTNTTSKQIIVNPKPTPIFSNVPDKCEYDAQIDLMSSVDLTGGTFSGTGIVTQRYFNPALVTPGTSPTITYSYTDGSLCSNTVTKTINVIAKPSITFNNITTSCENGTVLDLKQFVTPNTGTFSGSGVSGTDFTPTIVGSFPVTYSLTTNGCTNTAIKNSVVNAKPTLTITSNAVECINTGTKTVTLNPAGGTLKIDGTTITNINTGTIAAGNHSLTYDYTDPTTLCSNTTTKAIEIRQITAPTVANKTTLISSPDLTITTTTNNGGTLTWKNTSNVTVGTGATMTHPLAPIVGSWDYCVTESDGTCSSTAACMTFTIINCPTPAPTVTPLTKTICDGDAIPTFVATGTGTVKWYDNTNTLVFTGNSFTPTITAGTTGTINWTATLTDGGCEGIATPISLTINALPIVSITSNAVECINTGTKTVTVSPLGGTLQLDAATITNINTGTTAAGNYTLSYVYQNPTTLCSNSTTKALEIRQIPTPTVADKTTLISSPDLTITTTTNNGGTLTWKDASNVTVGTGASMTHPLAPIVGDWDYCVTESDGTCSSVPACMTYSIISCPTPAPTVTPLTKTICDGDAIPTFVATGTGTVKWYDNTNALIFTGNSFTPTITAGTTGTFNWIAKLTDGGCEGVGTSVSLTINAKPTVSITNTDTDLCFEGIAETIATTTNMPGGTFTYSGEGVSGNSINPANVTTFGSPVIITVNYTAPNTCTNSVTKNFTTYKLNQLTVPANITELKDDYETILSATPDAGNTIEWSNNCLFTTILGTGNTYATGLLGLANQDFTVRQSNTFGCKSPCATIHVDRIDCPTPPPTVNPATISICDGDAIPSFTSVGTGIMKWYDNANTLIYTGNTFTPTITTGTTGTFNWKVTQTLTCEGVATPISLTINPNPVVSITSNAVECINTGTKTVTVSPIGGTLKLDATTITNINTGTTVAGNYTLSYVYQNPTTLCSSSITKPIEIREIPKPGLDPSKTTLITSPDLVISTTSDNGGTLTWKNASNVTVGTGTSMTHPLAPSVGNWQYCVTETDGTCTSVPACITYTIINCPVPAPTTTKAVTQACINEPIPALTVSGTQTIRWYLASDHNTVIFTGASYTPTITATGTYDYYVTQFDGTCEGLGIAMKLVVSETPQPTVSGTTTRCEGSNMLLTANAGTGNILWYTSNPASASPVATANSYTISGYTAGNYDIWTVRENGCKSDPVKTTITIIANPAAPNLTGNDICAGENLVFNATGTDVTWYKFGDFTPTLAYANTYTVPNATGTAKTMQATQTVNGCSSQKATLSLMIKPVPQIPTGADAKICEYQSTPALQVTGEASATFNWYSDNTLLTNVSTTSSYTPTNKVSQTLYVTQSVNGCTSNYQKISLTVNPQPPVVLFKQTGDIEICENSTVTIGVESSEIINWYSSPLPNTPKLITSRYYTTPVLGVGTFTYYATQKNSFGCESEKLAKNVNVIAGPTTPIIYKESTVCQGQAAGTLIAKTNAPNESITWVTASGSVLQTGLEYTPATSLTANPGIYTFYAQTSVPGCPVDNSKKAAATLQVNPTPVAPKVLDTAFCKDGSIVELEARGNEVNWYNIDKSPISYCTNTEKCKPGILNTGSFKFFVSQTTNGCTSPLQEFNMIISKLPEPSITGPQYVCANGTSIYTVSKFNNENVVDWRVSGNRTTYEVSSSESGYTRSIDWVEPGLDTIFIVETNKYGCKGDTLLPVYITPVPDAQFITEHPGEEGLVTIRNTSEQQVLTENDSVVPFKVDYYWDFGRTNDKKTLNNTLSFDERYNYGEYEITLTAVNQIGCSNTITQSTFIDMNYGIYVPNAFSPNNPAFGVRTFKPVGYNLTSFKMYIFDTWGNLVYFSEGINSEGGPIGEWDGIYNGEILQTGTYIWKIEAEFVDGTSWKGNFSKGRKQSSFGNVVLLR